MPTRGPIRLATRGSQLARRQAGRVSDRLTARRYDTELVGISTRGDEIRDELIRDLGRKGAFVHSLDEAVLRGEADAAVHSLKDVPTEEHSELIVAAVPERASAGDVLVTPDGRSLEELDTGATVGTASTRRRAQLLAERPDLAVEPLRGNVDTRVEKLLAPTLQAEYQRLLDADGGDGDQSDEEPAPETWVAERSTLERSALEREVETEYDAIVLARAGLERLGLADEVHTSDLPPGEFVPAPGQGALAITAPAGELADRLRRSLDHPPTRVAVTTERTVLEALGGGCIAPIGVHATVRGPAVSVTAQVLSADGGTVLTESRELPVEEHRDGAKELAAALADRGAKELIAAAAEDES
ncbi:MAG: hydroxymethylbilane synthase [Halobacteriaceae archaeon]